MSALARLDPVLSAGSCRIEMPALDRECGGRDAVMFLGHYVSKELEVRIWRAAIGSAPTYARVSMLYVEQHFAGGEDGAVLEIDDFEGQHVVTFTAYYSRQELELEIRRKHMPSHRVSALIALEGLAEFFTWCDRAAQLCGVKPGSSSVKPNAFDGLELTRVDVIDTDADARQQRIA